MKYRKIFIFFHPSRRHKFVAGVGLGLACASLFASKLPAQAIPEQAGFRRVNQPQRSADVDGRQTDLPL
jgi:hypothetical protein